MKSEHEWLLYLASITKLMTGYIVYKALKAGKIALNNQRTDLAQRLGACPVQKCLSSLALKSR